MKKLLTILISSGALIYVILHFYYEQQFTYYNVANALFLIGLPLFFLSIIMVTNASEVFVAVSFTFKKVFFQRQRLSGMTLLDYKNQRAPRVDVTSLGLAGLLVSSIYIGVSLYISYAYF